MKRLATILLAVSLIFSASPSLAAPQAKPGAVCKKAGTVSVVAQKKFTCVKSGKKLVWNKGVKVVAKPTPKPTLAPLEAISTFSAARTDSVITYSWLAPSSVSDIKYFEIGIGWLTDISLDVAKYASYTKAEFYRVSQASPAAISISDLRAFLESKVANLTGQAIMVQVRTVTESRVSDWSNGIYTVATRLEAPISQPTMPNVPAPSSSATPTSTPTPAATSQGVYSVSRTSGFNSISCPGGTSYVDGGLGTIPEPAWYDIFRNVSQYVTVSSGSASRSGNTVTGRGTAITYAQQNNGSYLAPNGQRYYEFARGSWNVPVWISCGGTR